jgi:[ribosomal protein S5]-alanine N-acetyltransferase
MERIEINSLFCIETERLCVKKYQPNDITQKYLDALNDDSIIGLTEARHQKWDRKSASEFILNANKSGESIIVGIFLKKDDKHIGNVRLFNFNIKHRRAELAFLFCDIEEWGKGYATEALTAMVNYAFEQWKLHRIHADYYELNTASAKVFKKLGFNIEGVFKDHFLLNGEYINSIRVGKITGIKE